jgi:hypothetical protein
MINDDRGEGGTMQASDFSSCRRPVGLAAAVFLGLVLTGCSGSTGPEMGRLDVIFGQVGSGLAARVSAPGALAALGSQLGVPLDQVLAINVTVTSIQVHRVGADDGDGTEGTEGTDGDEGDGPWIEVELLEGETIVNLVGMSPQTVASGHVPAGTYNKLRLFISASTILFSEPVTVGGMTYEAGPVYDLVIPSSDNTGIKVQTGFFDIAGGDTETVGLMVDLAKSVKNVTANQNGLKMTPVIIGTVGVPEGVPEGV